MTAPAAILITGASSGLGTALAKAYAAPGVRLVLFGRDATRLEAAAGRYATSAQPLRRSRSTSPTRRRWRRR